MNAGGPHLIKISLHFKKNWKETRPPQKSNHFFVVPWSTFPQSLTVHNPFRNPAKKADGYTDGGENLSLAELINKQINKIKTKQQTNNNNNNTTYAHIIKWNIFHIKGFREFPGIHRCRCSLPQQEKIPKTLGSTKESLENSSWPLKKKN